MSRIKLSLPTCLRKLPAFLFIVTLLLLSCNDNDVDKKKGATYDPNQPIGLNTFYPDSGRYLEKVLLTGSNFGTDPDKIRVYFNSRKAPVIGSTGERMYVLAPRLPGDTCIISVAIGEDSVSFEKTFEYHTSVSVTTIAGNGNDTKYMDGNLADTQLKPFYLCVDSENNIFIVTRARDGERNHSISRIDEEANELITLAPELIGNSPAVNPITGVVSIPTETSIGSFATLDPKEMWAPRIRDMKWPDGYELPQNAWKHSMVVNPGDGYIYTRYYHGDIVRIHPTNYLSERIYMTETGSSFGATFTPTEPNILYIAMSTSGGKVAHSILSIDVTDPNNTYQKVSGPARIGHRDGPLETAEFNNPHQIFSDHDGNIYVADRGNHCIRRITPDKMVETVLGMPGTAGWKDGGKEEALFNEPTGIGVAQDGSIYVADYGNSRVRKLSIN